MRGGGLRGLALAGSLFTAWRAACRTADLPVLYVFGQQPVEVSAGLAAAAALFPPPREAPLVLMADCVYAHAVPALAAALQAAGFGRVVASTMWSDSAQIAAGAEHVRFGRSVDLPPGTTWQDVSVFYLGAAVGAVVAPLGSPSKACALRCCRAFRTAADQPPLPLQSICGNTPALLVLGHTGGRAQCIFSSSSPSFFFFS